MSRIEEALDSLQEVKEILEGCGFKTITRKQREVLKENYNRGLDFEYCQDGGYIFLMGEDNFNLLNIIWVWNMKEKR